MKKLIKFLLCSLLAVCLLGCEKISNASININDHCIEDIISNGKIRIGVKDNVPGLSYYDEKTNSFSGLEIDLAYSIAAKIFDCSKQEATNYVEFTRVTVENRESLLQNGKIDLMLATYTITETRQLKFALSDSYYTDYVGIMVKKGSGITSLEDLTNKFIAVPRNGTTKEVLQNYLQSIESEADPIFVDFGAYDDMFASLEANEMSAMSVDVSILNGYLTNDYQLLEDRFGEQNYGAATLLENQPLIDLVNEVIHNS